MATKTDFIPTATYDVAQLNLLMGCFIKSGVVGIGDLKVTYKDRTAVVAEGKCILPDKSLVTVPAGGYIAARDFDEGYIYILDGKIMAGEMPEGTDDILLLAYIKDGEADDKRNRAYIYTEEGVN